MDFKTNIWFIASLIHYTQAVESPVSICDGTGKTGDNNVIGCVLFGDLYSQSQWAICLNESTLNSRSGLIENIKCGTENKNCWYPCEMAAFRRSKGRVHKQCKCHYDQNKKSTLDSSCYIADITNDMCKWFDMCLQLQLEDVLKCNKKVTAYVVENAKKLCNANNKLLENLSGKRKDGLKKIQSCLLLPLKSLLFKSESPACTSVKENFQNNVKYCFATFATEWICNIPRYRILTRRSAYYTMISEVKAVLGLKTYDDIYAEKWFWNFADLPCDIEVKDPLVKRILISTSQKDIALHLAKTSKWKDRCIAYDSKVFHTTTRGSILFIQISIFPYDRYDYYTKSCAQEPDMELEVNKLLRIANDNSEILHAIKCKDGETECIEADYKEVLENDDLCRSIGGLCEEDGKHCPGIYAESVLCSNKKKCCIEQGDDTVCPVIGGKCIEDFEICLAGSIVPAKCGYQRHCCVSYYIVQYMNKNDCKNIPIISRDSWGARKSILDQYIQNPVPYFIMHHSAGKNCAGLLECSKLLQEYQAYHMYYHGWRDIGYTFFIDDEGNVYQTTGWGIQGIHSNNFNHKSYAVSFFGNYIDTTPTEIALTSLKKLEICGQDDKWLSASFNYLGHRDVRPDSTECPGLQFYTTINKWERYSFLTDKDAACARENGKCQDKTIYENCINETYYSNKCIGHVNRKCCVPDQE